MHRFLALFLTQGDSVTILGHQLVVSLTLQKPSDAVQSN